MYPFDYVIGSVHVIGDWIFDDLLRSASFQGGILYRYMRSISVSSEARLILGFSIFWGIQIS